MAASEIITANELISGATVYFLTDGKWGPEFDRARVFPSSETTARERVIELAETTGRLISILSETVQIEQGLVVANRLRERIRADGPTTPRFQPQSFGEAEYVSL